MVFDPVDRTNDYFPGDLSAEGVNFAVADTRTTSLAYRKTVYSFNGLYSTAEGVDYSSVGVPWLFIGQNIQYVRPARGAFDSALVVGLRLQVRI